MHSDAALPGKSWLQPLDARTEPSVLSSHSLQSSPGAKLLVRRDEGVLRPQRLMSLLRSTGKLR